MGSVRLQRERGQKSRPEVPQNGTRCATSGFAPAVQGSATAHRPWPLALISGSLAESVIECSQLRIEAPAELHAASQPCLIRFASCILGSWTRLTEEHLGPLCTGSNELEYPQSRRSNVPEPQHFARHATSARRPAPGAAGRARQPGCRPPARSRACAWRPSWPACQRCPCPWRAS